nr:MAG TPA: hypothetical protein [Caudoviricetes sp.]
MDFGIPGFLLGLFRKRLDRKEQEQKAIEILNRLKYELLDHRNDYKNPKIDGFVKSQESEWSKNEKLFLEVLSEDDFSMINRYFTSSFYPAKALLNSKGTFVFSEKERSLLRVYAADADLTILVISKALRLPGLHPNIEEIIQNDFVAISQERNRIMNSCSRPE